MEIINFLLEKNKEISNTKVSIGERPKIDKSEIDILIFNSELQKKLENDNKTTKKMKI